VSVDPGQPEVGSLFVGKYRIERKLGQGGMGAVYAATHELLHQRVAIKVLSPGVVADGEVVTRFLNEARSAARIVSDHVVRVTDVATLESGVPYMVLELLHGSDLSQVVEQRGPLPVPQAVDWLLQACAGVAKAHALGIVHRDLKPSNLFLAQRDDGTTIVKVLDFGISKSTNPAMAAGGAVTATGSMLGSPYYMAPEQVRNSKRVDARADIWAMGIIAYELLTANRPFGGEALGEIFLAIVEQPLPSIAASRGDVPAGLEKALQRCLMRNPAERFASIAELARAIEPYASRPSGLSFGGAASGSGSGTVMAPELPVSPSSHALQSPGGPSTHTAKSWGESSASGPPVLPKRNRLVPVIAGAAVVLVLLGAGVTYRTMSAPAAGDHLQAGSSPGATQTTPAATTASPAVVAPGAPPSPPVAVAPSAVQVRDETLPPVAPVASGAAGGMPPFGSANAVSPNHPSPKRKSAGQSAPSARAAAPPVAGPSLDDLPDQSRR
jgi:serine/threonine protein kinase